MKPIVFIISYNRPIYLWVTLDSLYRKSSKDCRFIIIDNASTDPSIKNVIHAFERRGMFYKSYMMPDNKRSNFIDVIKRHLYELGDYHYFVESDVEVLTQNWDKLMLKYFNSANYGFLGSAIDKRDFVSPGDLNENNDKTRFLIKAASPERKYALDGQGISDVQPAGRITIRKSSIIQQSLDRVDLIYNDSSLNRLSRQLGFKTGIVKEVKHRHLSLLNYFDYHNYDPTARNNFFKN
jgi:hypothetical protein